MNTQFAVYLVVGLAILGANLPFLNNRIFAVFSFPRPDFTKAFWIRLLELLVCYLLVGALGFYLEASQGNRFPQGWQFYATTFSLFVVLAFPGFVYQYLRPKHD